MARAAQHSRIKQEKTWNESQKWSLEGRDLFSFGVHTINIHVQSCSFGGYSKVSLTRIFKLSRFTYLSVYSRKTRAMVAFQASSGRLQGRSTVWTREDIFCSFIPSFNLFSRSIFCQLQLRFIAALPRLPLTFGVRVRCRLFFGELRLCAGNWWSFLHACFSRCKLSNCDPKHLFYLYLLKRARLKLLRPHTVIPKCWNDASFKKLIAFPSNA